MQKDKPIHPPVGFHGDRYLLKIVHFLLTRIDAFVETGTNIGATLQYVARTYPHVMCISCEPRKGPFMRASNYLSDFRAKIYNETSQQFLKRFDGEYAFLKATPVMFWLDAHGRGFKWPLREEIKYITNNFSKGIILIDDFAVPGKKQFNHDKYAGQHCSFDFIKNHIYKGCGYTLYYPEYNDKTSKYHPLVGWGLFQFGLPYRLDREFPKLVRRAQVRK